MLAGPIVEPLLDAATCSEQGPRRYNADAAAYYRSLRTGMVAVAVADGVGDSPEASWAAHLAADHAVRVAALGDGPGTAIASARDVLRSASRVGDAAMVVAVSPSAADPHGWSVAWVGDCRAYAWRGGSLQPLTRDQTVAEALRAHHVSPAARWEHVLTHSVRTTDTRGIGTSETTAPDALVLISDGVYRALSPDRIADLLGHGGTAAEAASRLTTAARQLKTTDNATAMVLRCTADANGTVDGGGGTGRRGDGISPVNNGVDLTRVPGRSRRGCLGPRC